jgi:hypothetical protein
VIAPTTSPPTVTDADVTRCTRMRMTADAAMAAGRRPFEVYP